MRSTAAGMSLDVAQSAPPLGVRLSAALSALIAVTGILYLAAIAPIYIPEGWTLLADAPYSYNGENAGVVAIVDYTEGPISECDITRHISNGPVAQVSRGQLSPLRGRARSDVTYWRTHFTVDTNGAARLDTALIVRDKSLPVRQRFESRASGAVQFQLIDAADIPSRCAPPGRYQLTCSGPTMDGCRAFQALKWERYRD